MLEVAISYFVDEKQKSRIPTTLLIGLFIFILGIPASLSMGAWKDLSLIGNLNFFDLYDKLTSNILLPTGGFLLCIFVGWVLKAEEAVKEIESSGVQFKLAGLWCFLIKYVVPAAIFIVLINSYKNFILALI